MKRDQKFVVEVERAMSRKYGQEAVQNPKSHWDDQKEKDYLEQLKKVQEKEDNLKEKRQKIKQDDVFIDKRFLDKKAERSCPVCSTYSFSPQDDLYINKFSCCKECYIVFVEHREEKWKSGWRPDKDEVENRRFKKDNNGRS
tara:strand:+ start:315 stop:740 length:426 start_codon:yes stop_codon:yes gene_type:complete